MKPFDCIVLAAGKGTRMRSRTNKVLHPFAGRPLVYYPIQAALAAGAARAIVVCAPDQDQPISAVLTPLFGADRIRCVVQQQPRGTGDAARVGLEACSSERVGIVCGDTPLLEADDLRALWSGMADNAVLSLLSCHLDDPSGYGRVLRDAEGRVRLIREHRDASPDEREVREVNAGVYGGVTAHIQAALSRLSSDNDQGELYLTDIVERLAKDGEVFAQKGRPEALLGVNDREQLHRGESAMLARIRTRLRLGGVTIRDHVTIEDTVAIGVDTVVESGAVLRGNTVIGEGVCIGIGCVLDNATIESEAVLKPYSVVTDSSVGTAAQIGPFAHLRPGSVIEAEAHIGNFVETKKTRVRRGAKANHLAYLGDGDVGEKANVGAGTIFCNYDGFRKHRTVIGAGAFIGSDSQIVAPVVIGPDSYVATGTTVTKDVPAQALAIGRVNQQNKEGYAPRLRQRLSRGTDKGS